MLLPAAFIVAIMILASLGAWYVLTAAFSPWHLFLYAAEFAALLLIFHLLWVLIGRLRK